MQKDIGYTFRDPSLLAMALVHRSYTPMEGHEQISSNERLEFLGDAVLNLLVTEYLYHTFPDKQEGDLTQIKSRIVSRTVIAEKAKEFQLGRYLMLGPGEEQSGGRSRTSIIADGFEALLGAMYLDGGTKAVTSFLQAHLLNDLDRIILAEEHTNYKSLLLEYCQGLGRGQPVYRVSRETGPEHEKEFTVVVKIEGVTRGTGVGRNKREAEQRAAKEALEKIGVLGGT
ncbi:MAG: ribonuclease III [bacterium]